MGSAVLSTPVAKDGVLYVMSRNQLFALKNGARWTPPAAKPEAAPARDPGAHARRSRPTVTRTGTGAQPLTSRRSGDRALRPNQADLSARVAAARAASRRARARDRRLALPPGDRLPVLARPRRSGSPSTRASGSTASTTCASLGHFEDDWLRGGPVRRWVPKAYADAPIYVFETGGSTGVPKSRLNVDDFRIDYSLYSETLSDDTFPRGADWLMLGPTGPRRLRLSIEHLAQVRGGIAFRVDLDPRWVIKLIRDGQMQELQAYKDARHRPGADDPARARIDPLHVHDAEAARGAVREDRPRPLRHHRHLLRRHRADAAVPPLRARGAGARHRLRPHLRQHAHGPRLPKPFDPADEATRSSTTRRSRAPSSRSSTPTTPTARWATARPGA